MVSGEAMAGSGGQRATASSGPGSPEELSLAVAVVAAVARGWLASGPDRGAEVELEAKLVRAAGSGHGHGEVVGGRRRGVLSQRRHIVY